MTSEEFAQLNSEWEAEAVKVIVAIQQLRETAQALERSALHDEHTSRGSWRRRWLGLGRALHGMGEWELLHWPYAPANPERRDVTA